MILESLTYAHAGMVAQKNVMPEDTFSNLTTSLTTVPTVCPERPVLQMCEYLFGSQGIRNRIATILLDSL